MILQSQASGLHKVLPVYLNTKKFSMKYFFIAALIFICSCKSNEKKVIERASVKNGDVNIAYDLRGSGDTMIFFVHGWAINKEYWQSQENLFSKRFTTVALDLGGHGQSGKNRDSWTVYDYANDVIALINVLKADKVILVGHSMSGDVIAAVADSIPQKIIGLVGIDNFKDIATTRSKEEQDGIDRFVEVLHSRYDSVITAYCYSGLFPPKYADSAIMKKLVKDVLQTDSAVSIKTIEAMMQSSLTEGDRLSRVRLPVHVITSDYAPVNKPVMERYCKAGFKEKVIRGTGHYPMIEKPEEFNLLLAETFDEIAQGK
jgi:pimeloyl-ACP methyl ester carboxylesterase